VNSSQLEGCVIHVASTWLPNHWKTDASIDALRASADVLETKISEHQASMDGLLDLAGSVTTASARAALRERLDAVGGALNKCKEELARVRTELADYAHIGDDAEVIAAFARKFREIDEIATGRDGVDGALRLREELARIVQKIVVHQSTGHVEFSIKGREKPVWLPLDFVDSEPPSEPSAAQLEAAERDLDALVRAMEDAAPGTGADV
jgi:hypothetical protein